MKIDPKDLKMRLFRDRRPDEIPAYLLHEALGAFSVGTRIEKSVYEEGDGHRRGALGTVLSSMGPIDYKEHKNLYGYFVLWDEDPDIPVFVAGYKIKLIE